MKTRNQKSEIRKKVQSLITKVWSLIIISSLVILISSLIISAAEAKIGGLVADPMSIGVGARAIGMGRAYVGVAEGGDALFMNPAGIARITGPKLTSMYTSLLNDVEYMIVGGAFPLSNKSALGAGIINSRMSDSPLTTSSGEVYGSGTWSNTVLFLSYGAYLSDLPFFSDLNVGGVLQKDILVGANVKFYSVGGTGSTAITDAAGNAIGADIAMLYPVTDYFLLGANYQNVIATQVTKPSDVTEKLASNLKIGAKFSVLGRDDLSYTAHKSRRLYAMVDYDIPSNNTRPQSTHLGLEFWPSQSIAFRIGSDSNELTAGLGLRYGGIEFNYAYHPFSGIAENNSHFFSLGYLGEATQRALRVQLDQPTDKLIVRKDHVTVSGKVLVDEGDEVANVPLGNLTVKVNGVNVSVNKKDNTFSGQIPVNQIGKNSLFVEASATSGDYASSAVRIVRLITFADVPEGYWAHSPIENTGTVGLVEGYPDGSFRPDNALTRAELATLLVRAKGLKLPQDRTAQKVFNDVKSDFWAAKYIEVAKKAGLVKGYPDGSFRPNNRINKVEGVAVLARFENLKLAEVQGKPYWDISAKHWGAKYVQAAKEAGMLTFVERNRLNPKEDMARAESVEMLSKTTLAGGKVKDLYTWEKGFFKQETTPSRPNVRASL